MPEEIGVRCHIGRFGWLLDLHTPLLKPQRTQFTEHAGAPYRDIQTKEYRYRVAARIPGCSKQDSWCPHTPPVRMWSPRVHVDSHEDMRSTHGWSYTTRAAGQNCQHLSVLVSCCCAPWCIIITADHRNRGRLGCRRSSPLNRKLSAPTVPSVLHLLVRCFHLYWLVLHGISANMVLDRQCSARRKIMPGDCSEFAV